MAAEFPASGRSVSVCLAAAAAAVAVGLAGGVARGDVRTFAPVADNTIFRNTFSPESLLSSGSGDGIYTGRTLSHADLRQRGLVRFDLSAIPCGATVTRAQLTMYMERGASAQPPTPVRLHRLLGAWGEGASVSFGGAGSESLAGDANWLERQSPGVMWTVPGGDYVATSSATASVSISPGAVTWASNPAMIADVTGWISNPSSNNGWIIINNEVNQGTARKFSSRESTTASHRPALLVEYTLPLALGITQQPAAVTICPGGRAPMSVTAQGGGTLSYTWQVETSPGVWMTLGNDPEPYACPGGGGGFAYAVPSGAASVQVAVSGCAAVSGYRVRVIVSNACGTVTSQPAMVTVAAGCSLADVAGTVPAGSDSTCGDGTVDGTDFIAFINSFGIGDAATDPVADVAGGGADGLQPDGTIDGSDFIAFINAFALGC
jgi:hypothetical protein